jgi:hypothetical protein
MFDIFLTLFVTKFDKSKYIMFYLKISNTVNYKIRAPPRAQKKLGRGLLFQHLRHHSKKILKGGLLFPGGLYFMV